MPWQRQMFGRPWEGDPAHASRQVHLEGDKDLYQLSCWPQEPGMRDKWTSQGSSATGQK